MKKYIALFLCLIMMILLVSCDLTQENKGAESSTAPIEEQPEKDVTEGEDTTGSTESTRVTEAERAMQMYDAAIRGEICVVDERLGEIKLKDCRFPSNNWPLSACKILYNAILDMDGDGVNEYVIKSPDHECIILRYYNDKVYSYWLDTVDFYNFNTNGSFHWYDSLEEDEWECGLSKLVFEGSTLNVKSVYSMKYSSNPTKYEYFIGGEVVTKAEYYSYRADIRYERVKFSQFELMPRYPITAQQAWNLANAYWDNQDGAQGADAGTIWTARIVLIDTPNTETNYYRFAFQVECNVGGGQEGYECMPPRDFKVADQILVNAITGEVVASTYDPEGKVVSVEEAIEIAKDHATDVNGEICNEENGYRVEPVVTYSAPDHFHVIVVRQHDTIIDRLWIDKYTGELVHSYYLYGKG